MKKIFLILLINFILFKNSFSSEQLTFPFTVDDQVQTFAEKGEVIVNNNSTDIKSNNYWNKPFTKFDYYLTQIKDLADEAVEDIKKIYPDGSGFLVNAFEKKKNPKKFWSIAGQTDDYEVSNTVFFNEDKGKVIINISIRAGKALKPLKETCKNIIENEMANSWSIPAQSLESYASPNRRLLGLLNQNDSLNYYDKELKVIADNIVYGVNINSNVLKTLEKSDADIYSMYCYKLNSKDEIIYRKWSGTFKE